MFTICTFSSMITSEYMGRSLGDTCRRIVDGGRTIHTLLFDDGGHAIDTRDASFLLILTYPPSDLGGRKLLAMLRSLLSFRSFKWTSFLLFIQVHSGTTSADSHRGLRYTTVSGVILLPVGGERRDGPGEEVGPPGVTMTRACTLAAKMKVLNVVFHGLRLSGRPIRVPPTLLRVLRAILITVPPRMLGHVTRTGILCHLYTGDHLRHISTLSATKHMIHQTICQI